MTRITNLAAVVAAAVLLAACSGGDDKAEPTTTTVDVAAALQASLLTPEDLATGDALDVGWEVGDVSAGVDIQLPDCVLEAPDDGVEVKLVTKNDLKLPSLEEDLARPTDPAATFAAAAARLDGCTPEFVFQGTPSEGTIERLALTLGGDESAAWRTTVTIAGAAVSITSIHVVAGDDHMSLVHVDIGTPEPTVLEGFADKALTKLG